MLKGCKRPSLSLATHLALKAQILGALTPTCILTGTIPETDESTTVGQNVFSADRNCISSIATATYASEWKAQAETINCHLFREGTLSKRCVKQSASMGKTFYWAPRHVVLTGKSIMLANEDNGVIRGTNLKQSQLSSV